MADNIRTVVIILAPSFPFKCLSPNPFQKLTCELHYGLASIHGMR